MKHMCHTLGYCQEVPNAKAKCSVSTLTAHFHRLALVVDLALTFSFTYGIETSGLGSGEREEQISNLGWIHSENLMCSVVTMMNDICTLGDSPGDPVAKTLFPMQGARVGSLVKKL